MRKPLKAEWFGLLSLVLCGDLFAIAPENRAEHYKTIPELNAFRLKPAPPVEGPAPTVAPIPKLLLTGITTILGNKRVLLKLFPVASGPGQPAKEESLILTEGERQGSVEVLNIDENAGSVRVNNSGTVMNLTFEKDGVKLPSAPASPTAPPALPLPTNSALTATVPAPFPNRATTTGAPRSKSFPTRTPRANYGSVASQTPVPPNALGQPSAGLEQSTPVTQPQLTLPQDATPEEQAIVQELQRQSGTLPSNPPPVQTPTPPLLPQ